MATSTFDSETNEEVLRLSEKYSITPDRAFAAWAAYYILGLDEDDAVESVLIGGANDLGIDFFYIDSEELEIHIWQSKFTEESLERPDLTRILEIPDILSDSKKVRDLDANERVRQAAKDYRRLKNSKNYKTQLAVIHFGSLTRRKLEEIRGQCAYWGKQQLKERVEDQKSLKSARPPDEFLLTPDSFHVNTPSPHQARCIVATLRIKELFDRFHQFRHALFNDNVRRWKGPNTPINRQITETLSDPKRGRNFFVYNNGISILCDKVKIQDDHKTKSLLLVHPQIINGAQTIYTVGNTLFQDQIPDDAFILAKITQASLPDEADFRDEIIRFNNSQSPVKSRDLRSNDPIQKALFKAFEHAKPSYFYEYKEGLWDTIDRTDRVKFRKPIRGDNRKNFRIIDNVLLAQCKLSWQGQPGTAKSQKGQIFTPSNLGGLYEEVFYNGCEAQLDEMLAAFHVHQFFSAKKTEFTAVLNQAEAAKDDAKKRQLLPLQFLQHIQFFAVAAVSVILDELVPPTHRDATLSALRSAEPVLLDKLCEYIIAVSTIQFEATIQATLKSNAQFSMNTWFKNDSNFDNSFRQWITSTFPPTTRKAILGF